MNPNLISNSNHSQSLPFPLSPQSNSDCITADKPCKRNHIVLLDWDNTLFPTTAFFNNQHTLNSLDLQSISESVLHLLNTYCTIYGAQNIFIVTNGKGNWILHSLRIISNHCKVNNINNCFDSIYNMISNGEINSISACDLYSSKYPQQSMIWKYLAFKEIFEVKSSGNPCIVICIGDSYDEYNASKLMISQSKENIFTLHRLKLISSPSIREMNEQLQLMVSIGSVFAEITSSITIDYAAAKADFINKKC